MLFLHTRARYGHIELVVVDNAGTYQVLYTLLLFEYEKGVAFRWKYRLGLGLVRPVNDQGAKVLEIVDYLSFLIV